MRTMTWRQIERMYRGKPDVVSDGPVPIRLADVITDVYKDPTKFTIHINGDTLDNRNSNLEVVRIAEGRA